MKLLSIMLLILLPGVSKADDKHLLSDLEAREEVRFVVENLLRYHPNPFHVTSKEKFYRDVTKLLERKGDITPVAQYFDLSHLLSLVSDTHTQLHITEETQAFQSTFPLRFRIFPDGLYILAGNEFYKEAIGKKILSISGQNPSDVLEQLAHYSFSDNWPRKLVFAEMYLYLPETYEIFDLKTPNGKIELTLEDSNGVQSTVELSETWNKGLNDFGWATLNPFIPEGLMTVHDVFGTPSPYYQQRLEENFWYEFLDEQEKFSYLQINKQMEKEGGAESMDLILDWAQTLWHSKTVEVLIIDLRNDPGGNIFIGDAINGIFGELYVNHPTLRAVAVLFGTDTVSAGTILIAQLERRVEPILIGEPSGSAPNMFLHAKKFVLSHSKIEFEVSTDEYLTTREADTRRYILPDVPLALSFDDFAHGRDPLIEFAKTINESLARKIYDGVQPLNTWKRESQREAMK